MKIQVWHDAAGTIIAVGRALDEKHPAIVVSGHPAIAAEYDGDLSRLHETHFVDPSEGKLRKVMKPKPPAAL